MKLPLQRRITRLIALVCAVVATTYSASAAEATGAPKITVQPPSQTVNVGGTLSLTVTATGEPPPSYQWRKDGTSISGATKSSYSKTNIQLADAGTYTVYVSNKKGNVTSNPAVLTVGAPSPLVVDLWPGKPAGDIGIEGEEYSWIYDSSLVGPTELVTNVSKPTLAVYLPAADKNTGAAMVICPGGGYHNLFWQLEGEEVAAWLNSIGVAGIILKYRVPRRPGEPYGVPPLGPQLDAQRAISVVRSQAQQWGINPARIGMVGFSVGGHISLATSTAEQRTYERIDAIDDVSCRPNFAVLCYPGLWLDLLTIPTSTPPIFLTHASDDTIATSEYSANAYLALKRSSIPAELHIYGSGEHDFGVRQNGKLPSTWTQLVVFWLRSLNLLPVE